MRDATLYLARHALPGVPDYDNRFPGPGLGPEGITQARWMARYLSQVELDVVWASDFTRVKESLKPILECSNNTVLDIQYTIALREREPTEESHNSLDARVKGWFSSILSNMPQKRTAIVSHCGPINMILEYLDPHQTHFEYPFRCSFGCLTPIAGIWEIELNPLSGKLIQCPVYESAR